MKTKVDLRKKFRAICNNMPRVHRLEAAQTAAHLFTQQPFFTNSQRIACYLAVKDEFDCAPVIEAVWQAKKKCYVPVLAPSKENLLQFAHYQYGDALHLNRYAILEPVNAAANIAPEKLDIAIVPVVAFDHHGHRLGTGGGYYDRTFAFLRENPSEKPLIIGIAYAAQAIDSLPADPWDIRLDGVITEQGFMAFD